MTPLSTASNDPGGLEPLAEALPSMPPPTYQEVVAASLGPTYPPQSPPDVNAGQDELPSYDAATIFEDSLVLLLFSGIPPFIYESFLKNGVRGQFRLTGARILNLFGWAIGITTATLGLRNQAIPSSVLTVILVILCVGLYVLEKYKEDCQEFAPWLFEQDYKTHVAHGGFWAAQVLLSWYSPLITMRHVGEVYLNTRGVKRGPEAVVAVLLINLSIFGLFLVQAYLGRWIMVRLEFPARLRPLGGRHPLYLLVVEEAIILIPRLITCVAIYGALQLGVPSFRMNSKLWALESQQAAQYTVLFAAYGIFTFIGYLTLQSFVRLTHRWFL